MKFSPQFSALATFAILVANTMVANALAVEGIVKRDSSLAAGVEHVDARLPYNDDNNGVNGRDHGRSHHNGDDDNRGGHRNQYPTRPSPPPPYSHDQCAESAKHAAELYQLWNPQTSDDFYTANAQEIQDAVSQGGYIKELVTGRIFTVQVPGSVPFYRLWSGKLFNHFYTINASERANVIAAGASGGQYVDDGIAGYIYPTPMCGARPLYRMYSGTLFNNFYTANEDYRTSVLQIGYKDEGIAGYIL